MKNVLLILSFFILSVKLIAATEPTGLGSAAGDVVDSKIAREVLYRAITATESDARPRNGKGQPELGLGINKKSVGGLSCTMRRVISPGAVPTYSCSLSTENLNAKEIYEALNVAEVDARSVNDQGGRGFGAMVLEKSVDNLTCQKVKVVSERSLPKYNCNLDF